MLQERNCVLNKGLECFRDSFGENEEGTCLLNIQDHQQIEVLPSAPPSCGGGGGRFRTSGGRLTHHTQTVDVDMTPAGALPINSGKPHSRFLFYFSSGFLEAIGSGSEMRHFE